MGEAEGLSKTCDVITACASKWVREVARESITSSRVRNTGLRDDEGVKNMILEKLKEVGRQVSVELEVLPYLVDSSRPPLV
ncbi:MAG: hypothetical protein LM598_06115 [Candidatus Verstraetearchaeota archaeon]|nr:hypothetical protein [Candidatus Verstraetearchaeota archaeon]